MQRAIQAQKTFGLPATELEPQYLRVGSSHATHVASIAAGNHSVCPYADIIGVSLALPIEDMGRRSSLYFSSRLANAVDYLFQCGERFGKPVSINISLDTNGHAHDGSSAINRWLDHSLTKTGRVVCVVAGNAGQEASSAPGDMGYLLGGIHASSRIPAADLSRNLEWIDVGNTLGDLSENELEIWYSTQDRFAVAIKPPGGEWIGPVEPGWFIKNEMLDNGTFISIFHQLYVPANG